MPGVGLDRACALASQSGTDIAEGDTGEYLSGLHGSRFGLQERRAGRGRILDDAAEGRFAVVWAVWAVSARSIAPVGRSARLRTPSEAKCRSSALQSRSWDRGDESLVKELMDDVMASLASLSGRFYQLRRNGIDTGFGAAPPHGWRRCTR